MHFLCHLILLTACSWCTIMLNSAKDTKLGLGVHVHVHVCFSLDSAINASLYGCAHFFVCVCVCVCVDGPLLYARVLYPPDFSTSKTYPVFFYVYGGPNSQMVMSERERDRDRDKETEKGAEREKRLVYNFVFLCFRLAMSL